MSNHENIQKIAALSFAEHIMQDAPAKSWHLGKPGTSAYAFRITWAVGVVAVSGDIGTAVYEVWPAFQTLEGAIDLIGKAGFDYLTSKSEFKEEYDREATVEALIESAYEAQRRKWQPQLFKQLCDEYGGDENDPADRKDAVRQFRDDDSMSAERIYNLTGDFEDPLYRHTAAARWAFEAVKLWAAKMKAEAAQVGSAA
ncbi:hypothetical protein CIW48_26905 [Methylobacterium sp. P1-11]|nr:hypothetical protein CIW48_26905 [Methylobacterium sp. P1-11]